MLIKSLHRARFLPFIISGRSEEEDNPQRCEVEEEEESLKFDLHELRVLCSFN